VRLADPLLRRLPAFRRTFTQIPDYAQRWVSVNAAALAEGARGPLWVVLGDSTAQGVGASSYDKGWVGLVRDSLPESPQWRVVNLSRSGDRTRDVIEQQVPRLQALRSAPRLVTAVVGGNDLTHTRLQTWLADLRELLGMLPAGAVVATAPRGWHEGKARVGNEVIRAVAAERGLHVADLWAHTGPPYRGLYADGFHPNDRGYLQWAAALRPAVAAALAAEHDGQQ